GYSIGLSAGASATVGSTGSANITVVNFPTSSEFNDYNYVFAGYEYTYGGGSQLQVSANIEANFFVAYSNFEGDRKPASFEGNASTYGLDRKSTRLNSSHVSISYPVFCLKNKT